MRRYLYSFLILMIGGLSAQETVQPRTYPVVIVGSGVGALTSAIYLQRAGIDTLVVEGATPGGAIAQSPSVHNWPGEVEISGEKLIEKIRHQAEHNGASFVARELTHIDLSQRPFTLSTRSVYDYEDTSTIQAKAVIIAMGSNPRFLGVPGESGEGGYWTRGVFSCAVCDGGLYRGKTVAVIGGGDSAVLEAGYLSKLAKKVYVILRSDRFRAVETLRKDELIKRDNVEVIYNTKISEIVGNGNQVTHLNLSTKKKLPVDGVFLAIGADPNTQLFQEQLALDQHGYIHLADGQATSVPGVFAIGDIVDPLYKQAVSAAGDGAKAALQVEHFLASAPSPLPNHRAPAPKIVQAANPGGSAPLAMELKSEKVFYDSIGGGESALIVDFYSPHCNPCREFGPRFSQAAERYAGKARFLKVDVTQFPKLAESYGVYSLPTVMVFDPQGKQVVKASGLKDTQKALDKLDRFIK